MPVFQENFIDAKIECIYDLNKYIAQVLIFTLYNANINNWETVGSYYGARLRLQQKFANFVCLQTLLCSYNCKPEEIVNFYFCAFIWFLPFISIW